MIRPEDRDMKSGTMDRRKSRYDGIIWFIQKSVPLYIMKRSEVVLQWGKRKNIKKLMLNGELVIEWKKEKSIRDVVGRIFVMIRKLLNGDIDRVADIWLKTNLKAHYFISNQYWKSNYEIVKGMMSQSEVYVFEADKMIQGFVGLNAEYIEGIFVSEEMQSCGIGKLLLDYIKDKKVRLQLNVYQKNTRALSFYQREGFIVQCEGLDEATGEKEYTMLWKRK